MFDVFERIPDVFERMFLNGLPILAQGPVDLPKDTHAPRAAKRKTAAAQSSQSSSRGLDSIHMNSSSLADLHIRFQCIGDSSCVTQMERCAASSPTLHLPELRSATMPACERFANFGSILPMLAKDPEGLEAPAVMAGPIPKVGNLHAGPGRYGQCR